jgi:hypothetical protein
MNGGAPHVIFAMFVVDAVTTCATDQPSPMKLAASIFTLCLALAWLAQSAPVKIQLPLETAALKTGPGVELAAASCLTCHSVEYISTQPSLTRTAWKASVDKMRAKFGAPIPDDAVEKLADYLAAAYGKAEPALK